MKCVNEDVAASSYASDALLVHARESVPIYGVPPAKRIKRIWKKNDQVQEGILLSHF